MSEARPKSREWVIRKIRDRWHFNYSEASEANIAAVQEELARRPGVGFTLVINHISKGDVIFADEVMDKIDPGRTRHRTGLVSQHHYTMSRDPKNALLLRAGAWLAGYEEIPVVQVDSDGEIKYGYSEDDKRLSNLVLVKTLREIKKAHPEGLGFGFASESERSQDGVMKLGNPHAEGVVRMLAPTMVVPMGIVYASEYEMDSFNFGAEVDLRVGPAYLVADRKDATFSYDLMMRRIAGLLDEPMRGPWR